MLVSESSIERFHKNIRPSGEHILWIGPKLHSGHGYIDIGGTSMLVAAFAWYLHYGKKATKNVLHKVECHKPSCVRIEHLYEGNQSENQRDSIKNGTNRNTNKKLCSKGHKLVYISYLRQRSCRICNSERVREWKRKKREN